MPTTTRHKWKKLAPAKKLYLVKRERCTECQIERRTMRDDHRRKTWYEYRFPSGEHVSWPNRRALYVPPCDAMVPCGYCKGKGRVPVPRKAAQLNGPDPYGTDPYDIKGHHL